MGHCFLQGTSLVRKTLLLHCKHVTVDGVVFSIPRWASLHDLVELLPFADFPFRVINCHIVITFSDIIEIFQNQMLCPYGYILFHTAQSCYQIHETLPHFHSPSNSIQFCHPRSVATICPAPAISFKGAKSSCKDLPQHDSQYKSLVILNLAFY